MVKSLVVCLPPNFSFSQYFMILRFFIITSKTPIDISRKLFRNGSHHMISKSHKRVGSNKFPGSFSSDTSMVRIMEIEARIRKINDASKKHVCIVSI